MASSSGFAGDTDTVNSEHESTCGRNEHIKGIQTEIPANIFAGDDQPYSFGQFNLSVCLNAEQLGRVHSTQSYQHWR